MLKELSSANLNYGCILGLVVGAEQLEQLGGLVGVAPEESAAVQPEILFGLLEFQLCDVVERLPVSALVLHLHPEIPAVLAVALGEGQCVTVVAGLAAYTDGDVHIKVKTLFEDEVVESGRELKYDGNKCRTRRMMHVHLKKMTPFQAYRITMKCEVNETSFIIRVRIWFFLCREVFFLWR